MSHLYRATLILLLAATPLLAESVLNTGDAAPQMTFTDIEDHQGHSNDYADRIRVYTFADKDSSERLTEWMNLAGLEIMQKHPDIRIAYLNFADVSSVPRLFRGIVTPILRRINRNSQEDLEALYAEAGITLEQAGMVFHLTPDWTGAHLETFGIPNAETYYIWIAGHDTITATVHEGTNDIRETYVQLISEAWLSRQPVTSAEEE